MPIEIPDPLFAYSEGEPTDVEIKDFAAIVQPDRMPVTSDHCRTWVYRDCLGYGDVYLGRHRIFRVYFHDRHDWDQAIPDHTGRVWVHAHDLDDNRYDVAMGLLAARLSTLISEV